MTPLWKEIISKKYNRIFRRLNIFANKVVGFLSLQDGAPH